MRLFRKRMPREPGPFKEVDDERISLVADWVLALPVAPEALEGDYAIHADDRGAPGIILETSAFRAWVEKELLALERVAKSRIAANAASDGPGETVDSEFECQGDREAMIARVLLFLVPRDPDIGNIVMMFQAMRIDDERLAVWSSGLDHD